MLVRCNNCFEEYEDSFDVCPHCSYVKGNPASELYYLYPGMILNNKYIIGQVIGSGGFGIIYKAWDKNLEIVVAIKEHYPTGIVNRVPGTKKVILFTGNKLKEFNHGLVRFLDEARNTAKFSSHKNIINIFEYFEENGTAYIVMEYLDGIALNEFLKTNTLNLESSLEIIHSVSSALIDIHSSNIVHRDISPDNIFICTNGLIKVMDFGAARFSANEEMHRTIVLKPGFAPPEQYESVSVQGPWTDIYALGATLYQMVTGVKPEESTNRKVSDTLQAPNEIDNTIPEYISNTIMKAMAIDRHMRFSSVEEFEKALNQEKKVLPLPEEKKKRKLKRLIGVLSAFIVLVVSASIFLINWNKNIADNTLPDSSITLWYSLSDDETANEAKKSAYDSIIEAFNTGFLNVKIEAKSFHYDDYILALKDALEQKNLPSLFESTGLDAEYLNEASNLNDVVKQIDAANECNFFDKYSSYFPDSKQIPLGFNAPAVYANSILVNFDLKSIKELNDIVELKSNADFMVSINPKNEDAFVKIFGDDLTNNSKVIIEDSMIQFFNEKACVYLSNTSDFFKVQAALPARYKIASLSGNDVSCEFSDLFSIGKCSSNEKKAAERLLLFMLSDNAQDFLHIRNKSNSLPINKKTLVVFCDVYNDFNGFFNNINNYSFK